MNTPRKIEVIAQPGEAPEAVMINVRDRIGSATVKAAQRMMGRIHCDFYLSEKWSKAVFCTPEFSSWWRAHDGRPRGFMLEVLS